MVLVGLSLVFLFKGDNKETEIQEKKTLSTLEEYGYTLDDFDTEIYKTEFNTLKANLESNTINYDEYAKSIAKLFLIDLYTLSNKINKYDVGGVEFVYTPNVENYKLKVEDTLYKYVEDNSKDTRKQKLPTVKSVDVSIESTTYTYKPEGDSKQQKMDAYNVKATLEYETSSDYPTKVNLVIIKENNKLYIAEVK